MIFFQLGYQWYALPDEHGEGLLRLMPYIRRAVHQGYGKDERFALSDESVEIGIHAVPDSRIIANADLSLPDVAPPLEKKTDTTEIPF